MNYDWALIKRDGVRGDWAGVRASLNRKGSIAINRAAWQRMGEPKAFHVMFDKHNSLIALKPTAASMSHAYPAQKYGRNGGRLISVLRLLTEYNIRLPDTLDFPDAEIDQDGLLILDLRTARVSPRAKSQHKKRS